VHTPRSRIVIVRTQGICAGIIVDSVREVIDLPAGQIEVPAPTDVTDMTHVSGIAKSAGCLIMMLDLGNVLGLFTDGREVAE
jgi:chemotaxis signal transduction protein